MRLTTLIASPHRGRHFKTSSDHCRGCDHHWRCRHSCQRFPTFGLFFGYSSAGHRQPSPQTLSPLDGRHFETSLADRRYWNHRFRLHLTRRRFPPLSGRFLASTAWPVDPDLQQPLPCHHWSFPLAGTAGQCARFSLVTSVLPKLPVCLFVPVFMPIVSTVESKLCLPIRVCVHRVLPSQFCCLAGPS